MKSKISFNRHEFAGAFGDIGTDLPLIVGMILVAQLDAASVLVVYGIMQVATGLIYKRPMPVQPLKAVAAIVISQKIAGPTLYGAGLAIALIMLLLTLSGTLDWLTKNVPKCVIRGIQAGLGISLATLALKDYVGRDGINGYVLAGIAFVLILILLPNKKFPAALVVIALGLIYAFIFKIHPADLKGSFGLHLPQFAVPSKNDIWIGFMVLAIPQIPLSLGNSILATRQVNDDLFPQRPLKTRRIGLTYSLMNFFSSLFGGVPVCHGSGGMMGHYTFGARTGGSLFIYGGMYIILGLFLSQGFAKIINIFPMPILGIILFFEALALIMLIRDIVDNKSDLWIAFMVALICASMPNGYIIGLVIGVLIKRIFNGFNLNK